MVISYHKKLYPVYLLGYLAKCTDIRISISVTDILFFTKMQKSKPWKKDLFF
jgi:hypothetical protein